MPFDEKPSPGQQPQADGNVDEFTRLFGALNQPAAPPDAQPFAVQPEPEGAADPAGARAERAPVSGEFTQIFRPIAKPTSRPPSLDEALPLPTGAGPGEFTQFFSSMKPGAESAPIAKPAEPVPAPPPQVAAAPEPPSALRSADPDSFTQIFGRPLSAGGTAAPVAPMETSSEHLGRAPAALPFADVTTAQARRNEIFAGREDQTAPLAPFPPAVPDVSPSALTQIFEMDPPAPVRPQAVPDRMPAPVRPSPVAATPGPGEFTRLMQELNASPTPNSPSPFHSTAAPEAAAAPAGPGEFTRLMQGLGASSPGEAGLSPMPAAQPVARVPQSAGPLAGPGEFTRVMQSLGSAPAASASSAFRPAAPLDTANVVAGESEFTRVMRGSSLRDASAPSVTPAAAATPAGVPTAQTATDKAEAATGAKSKKWLLILLVANLVLLLVLILLAVLFLRHRH